MRLVAWNASSGGAAKWSMLSRLAPDVAVIGEAPLANPRPAGALLDPARSWVSTGSVTYKGLAIASPTGRLTDLGARPGQGRWTVAARPESGPAVLGVWACPTVGGGDHYADEVIASLDAWADDLAGGDMVVAGDLNIGHAVGRPTRNARLARAQAQWESLGLTSAYHAFTGEDVAAPTRSTYHHHYREDEGWHIDYVLVPTSMMASVRSVAVGGYGDWVGKGRSDHAPLVVDLDL